jgi:hypothetical protein
MAEVVTVAAIAAATAVAADARRRVTAVAVAIRRRAADPRTVAVGHRTAVDRRQVVAADMDGDAGLDSFPA